MTFRPAPAGLAASAMLLSLLAAPRQAHALPFELDVPAAAAAADSVEADEANALPVGTQRGASGFFRKILVGAGAVAGGTLYAVTRAGGAPSASAAASTTPVAPLGANPLAAPPSTGTTAGADAGSTAGAGASAGSADAPSSPPPALVPAALPGAPVGAADVPVLVNPEPGSLALMGAGAAGLLVAVRRRRAAL